MRHAWAIALIVLAGCSGPDRQPEANSDAGLTPPVACTDPRPEVCTMEYAPACAELVAGGVREYASPCSACSDPAVAGYRTGSCPQ